MLEVLLIKIILKRLLVSFIFTLPVLIKMLYTYPVSMKFCDVIVSKVKLFRKVHKYCFSNISIS